MKKSSNNIKIIKDHITKRNERFESLCLATQAQLKKKLYRELKKKNENATNHNGYLYKPGTIPILLVAHMDTVHKEAPREIIYANGTISSPQGIGGDDRCGIYMVMEILKTHDCHVVFTEDEERGGIGAGKFSRSQIAKELAGKLWYVIEMDRMDSNDAVFYQCENVEFEDFINKEYWKSDFGSYSDIVDICPVLKTAGVNLSCGYYKAHTQDEYVVLAEMEQNIKEIKKLIDRSSESFEYIETEYDDWKHDRSLYGWDDTGYLEDSYYYVFYTNENGEDGMQEVEACSYAEATGKFLMEHETLCYSNIRKVFFEWEMENYYDVYYEPLCKKTAIAY